jgi:hypothetical protein
MFFMAVIPVKSTWYDRFTMRHAPPDLHVSISPGASVSKLGENSWHFEIAASPTPVYRLAQLDDHTRLRRSDFHWKPPLTLKLEARVSSSDLPGTWGFGLWNDPFSFLLGSDRQQNRFPTLPNTAWFFHASSQNYLSFRDDLPACGFLAATFRSQYVPPALLALASPALALTLIPPTAQLIRRMLRRRIHQAAASITLDITQWHSYSLEWDDGLARFSRDGIELLHTNISPHPPLSLVIWIDNQYAALPPVGRLRYGTLPNPEPAWMEVRQLELVDNFV